MNAEIIAVGSELLLGQIQNANATYLSQELASLGIDVHYHAVVGDNPQRLEATIAVAQQRADMIIFTGGLGPTKDDLTKDTIAAMTGRELITDEKAMQSIEQFYKQRQITMSDNNRKQAHVISGATVFTNKTGMAPGMGFSTDDKLYMLFPGPPRELQPMFRHEAKPFLQDYLQTEAYIISRVLRFFGIGESRLETEILDLIESQTNPTIAPLAGQGEVTLRLTAKDTSQTHATQLIDALESQILQRVGAYFYGYNQTSLPKEVMQRLQRQKQMVAVAESLTGGLFAQYLTEQSGASAVFHGGVVCYSNHVKKTLLNVPAEILAQKGAVSAETARLLADNVKAQTGSDIGISFTGVAGPDASEGQEPGTVFIGLATPETTDVYALKLAGGRRRIRQQSALYGFAYLLQFLKM